MTATEVLHWDNGIVLDFTLEEQELFSHFQAVDRVTGAVKRRGILAIVCGLLAVNYLVSLFFFPDKAHNGFMAAVTVLLTGILLWAPRVMNRLSARRLCQGGESVHLSVGEEGIQWGSRRILWVQGLLGYEFDHFFSLIAGKDLSFCIPKRILPQEQQERMRRIFREKLGKDFILKTTIQAFRS